MYSVVSSTGTVKCVRISFVPTGHTSASYAPPLHALWQSGRISFVPTGYIMIALSSESARFRDQILRSHVQ